MDKEHLKIEIGEIKKREKNPKMHRDDLIETSISEFGYIEDIVVDENNVLLSGHGRLDTLKKLGYNEIDIIKVSGLTEKQKTRYALISNKSVEAGGWDSSLLKEYSEEDLGFAGFESGELDEIFGLEEADEFDEQKEFDKAVKNPRGVKTGDLWQLGEHRLIIGDCTKKENWEKLLGDERFDLMETDPPYRLAYCKKRVRKVKTKEGWKTKRVGETDKTGKVKGFGAKQNRIYEGIIQRGVPEYEEWLSIANEFQNPKGANVMIFENWKNTVDLWKAMEKYWKIKNIIIWHLPNRRQGFAARHQFFSKYDIAPLADKGKAVMNEESEEELEEYLESKGQKLLDTYEVIIYGKQGKSEWNRKKGAKWGEVADHITWTASSEASTGQNLVFGTKPVQILVPYIKILSPRDGIVMEPFAGAGSTILGCEIMKRKARAIEISETYGEVILNRFEKFANKEATKLN